MPACLQSGAHSSTESVHARAAPVYAHACVRILRTLLYLGITYTSTQSIVRQKHAQRQRHRNRQFQTQRDRDGDVGANATAD
eukprot:6203890-Pleurochrysis_carterae.AAC.2